MKNGPLNSIVWEGRDKLKDIARVWEEKESLSETIVGLNYRQAAKSPKTPLFFSQSTPQQNELSEKFIKQIS